jgi:hypothetical protein
LYQFLDNGSKHFPTLSNQLATLGLANSRARRWRVLGRDREVRPPGNSRSRTNNSVLRLRLGRRGLREMSGKPSKATIFNPHKTYRRDSANNLRNTLVLSLGRNRSHSRHAIDSYEHRNRGAGCPSRCRLPLGGLWLGDSDGAVVEAALFDNGRVCCQAG